MVGGGYLKQDRNGVRTAQDLERKYDFAGMKQAVKQSVEGINKTNTKLEDFINTTLGNLDDIHDQLDGNITTHYYSGVPTLLNPPASEWSESEYANHVGDLYYDRDTGYAYRFLLDGETGEYKWCELMDNDIAEALALANAAKDTADSKRRVFVVTPYPPYDNGDLWINNREIYICQISKGNGEVYVDNDFIVATKYTDDTLATQVGDNLEIVRGTVTTIQESVDFVKIELETTVKSVDSLKQETTEAVERMGYTFGTKDLSIANSNDPVNTKINNQGLKVFNYRTLQALFNHRGTGVQKLIVVGEAQLGNLSIRKAIDEEGNPCTDFNFLISEIQDLSDLEGGN